MLPQLSTFSGQQLSNTIYAHAFLGIRPAPDFLDRFIQVTLARMKSRDAAPQWISNTIWALASMCAAHLRASRALARLRSRSLRLPIL